MDFAPAKMFRGLPLSAEQDSEIRHYIHGRQRCGLPWDTPELRAMLTDMLDPPEVDEEDRQSVSNCMDTERTAAAQDEEMERDNPDANRV